MQDMAELKFASMATGELSVMISGTIGMQASYAESLGSHHMVQMHYSRLVNCKESLQFYIANCHNTGAIALHNQLTESSLPIAINDLNCTGSEERITACPQNALDLSTCNHRKDASVFCQSLEGNHNRLDMINHACIKINDYDISSVEFKLY